MDIIEKATRLHESGFNCAQSVLCACGEYTGLDEATALAVSGGMGGGVRCGEICGAATGGVMALGACAPFNDAGDPGAKTRISALAAELTRTFKEHFGCIRCQELKASGHGCPELIAYAAQLSEKMIKDL